MFNLVFELVKISKMKYKTYGVYDALKSMMKNLIYFRASFIISQ